jgi:hypothetical protein
VRSDELLDRLREKAMIGDVTTWPDWDDKRLLHILSERHMALMSEEIVTTRSGYGIKTSLVTCTPGLARYAVPDRAVGGALETLWIKLPGSTEPMELTREEVRDGFFFEQSSQGTPSRYIVQDGVVELYPTPDAAYTLVWKWYLRPSQIVQSQSSTLGGDAVDRGRITVAPNVSRQLTVNALPFDQSLGTPAAISSGVQRVDIVRPTGTFPALVWSQTQTISGLVLTLGGTDPLTDVRAGDYVRVEDQTDWPMSLPAEFQAMLAYRAAMEVLGSTGRAPDAAVVGQSVAADLARFRQTVRPQVKAQPKAIPLSPMYARGSAPWWTR